MLVFCFLHIIIFLPPPKFFIFMIITWFLSHCQGSDGKQELECMIFEMLLHCSTYDFFLTKPNCLTLFSTDIQFQACPGISRNCDWCWLCGNIGCDWTWGVWYLSLATEIHKLYLGCRFLKYWINYHFLSLLQYFHNWTGNRFVIYRIPPSHRIKSYLIY